MPSVPTAVAFEVYERDLGLCRVGGLHVGVFGGRGFAWSAHHRLAQGMGGTSLPWWLDPRWLLLVCGTGTTGCHGWLESNRTEAEALGYLLRHTTPPTDPDTVAVVPRGVPCRSTKETR